MKETVEDFNITEKEDIDLAIIQLKNKKTPEDASIFSIEAENEELKR